MSTKRDPGAFDCYARLADDEPYFVLRAKDPAAPGLIEQWANERERNCGNYPKLDEARRVAQEMRAWKARILARPSIPAPERALPDGAKEDDDPEVDFDHEQGYVGTDEEDVAP